MFTKEEIKVFIVEIGKKWFFPDFSNKITWTVITLGTSIILAPMPFKLIFFNFLIDTLDLNNGSNLKLADLGGTSADYWLGFSLVALALLHNVFSKWLNIQDRISDRHDVDRARDIDRKLFHDFITLLPSSTGAIQFLEQHDFGGTFNLEVFQAIDSFVYDWNCPEKSFLEETLEKIKTELWNKSKSLSMEIGRRTGPVRSGRQSVVTDEHLQDFNWPAEFDDDIRFLNAEATELFELHQVFVKQCRDMLMC